MHHTQTLLPWQPPFHWPNMLGFFRHRAIPGIEVVTENYYRRTIVCNGNRGWLEVGKAPGENGLILNTHLEQAGDDEFVVQRVRQMMDLDAPMAEMTACLASHPRLRTLLEKHQGTRLPGCWDVFEFSVRAILGQQISVKAATTLAGRIAHAYGEQADDGLLPEGLSHFFPPAQVLALQDFETIGLTRSRKATLLNLARRVASNELRLSADNGLPDFVSRLVKEPGIGPWTAHYLAMRGLSQADAFPASDLGIIKALSSDHGSDNNLLKPKQIEALAEQWRPWRAYAAIYLWQG